MQLEEMNLQQLWDAIAKRASKEPIETFEGIEAKAVFHIKGKENGSYTILFTNEAVTVEHTEIEAADCTFIMDIDNFKKLLLGKLNALTAYMSGRLEVKGNIQLALKLEKLMKKIKLHEEKE